MGCKKVQQACSCFLIGKKNLKYSTHMYVLHILQKIAFSQGPTYHRVCYVYDKHNVQYAKSKQTKKSIRKLYLTKSFDWMIELQIFFA